MVNEKNKSGMLPGRSAEQWARGLRPLGATYLSLTILGAAAYFLIGATAETVPLWLYILFILAIVGFGIGMFVYFATLVKAIRESKAGYTTTGGMYPELPQLDSETGEVLRKAGERRRS